VTHSAENDKPSDYLLIHKTPEGIRITPCTHYRNYSGMWCSTNAGPPTDLRWPGKKWSRFVTYDLPPED